MDGAGGCRKCREGISRGEKNDDGGGIEDEGREKDAKREKHMKKKKGGKKEGDKVG